MPENGQRAGGAADPKAERAADTRAERDADQRAERAADSKAGRAAGGARASATVRETEAVRALARASSVLERSSSELNLAHYRVLSAIASGQERASHVAARLALGRPAVSAAVESLS